MTSKVFVASAVSLGLLVSGALPALAQGTSVTASTTVTTSTSTTRVACVAAAVATREASIDSAMTTYTAAVNAAYSARATALANAYASTGGNAVIKAGVRAAWSGFSKSMRSARLGWWKSRTAAWRQFRISAKSCHAPVSVSDSANASLEASGQ